MVSKDRVILFTSYHRKLPFFEDSMKKFAQQGYNRIWIQDTGTEMYGQYSGPKEKYWSLGYITSYDWGMVEFRKRLLEAKDVDIVVHFHSDCYVNDPTTLDRYLSAFCEDNYDYVGYPVSDIEWVRKLAFNKYVEPAPPQKIISSTDAPPWIACDPNWETGYLMTTSNLWRNLTAEEVNHNRLLTQGLVRLNSKIGTIKTEFRGGVVSQYGDGWMHVGSVQRDFTAVEEMNLKHFSSGYFPSRLGFFLEQDRLFGTPYVYGKVFHDKVISLAQQSPGGVDSVLEAWDEYAKGTCMENWVKA
jgi:hypothetical protein